MLGNFVVLERHPLPEMIHTGRFFALLFTVAACLQPADVSSGPVLVELFTSEGCSSCPPADRLLESLDQNPNVIVLSEHVDYWDQLGWRDPYSSAAASHRQSEYARRFHLDSVYTPQMVLDGKSQMIGSETSLVNSGIAKAERTAKTTPDISEVAREGDNIHLRVRTAALPANATVYLALAEDRARSEVSRGENSGRTLGHVAVVRMLASVGTADARHDFDKQITLPLGWKPKSGLRVIVFLEDRNSGAILGAARHPGLL